MQGMGLGVLLSSTPKAKTPLVTLVTVPPDQTEPAHHRSACHHLARCLAEPASGLDQILKRSSNRTKKFCGSAMTEPVTVTTREIRGSPSRSALVTA